MYLVANEIERQIKKGTRPAETVGLGVSAVARVAFFECWLPGCRIESRYRGKERVLLLLIFEPKQVLELTGYDASCRVPMRYDQVRKGLLRAQLVSRASAHRIVEVDSQDGKSDRGRTSRRITLMALEM